MSTMTHDHVDQHDDHDTVRTSTGLPTGRVAMWWFLASEIAIFGGLIATYLLYRLAHPEWNELAAQTNSTAGAINTFVLLTSSLVAVLAHDAAHQGDLRKASNLTLLTVTGGVVFLCVKSVEYYQKFEHGLTPAADNFWGFYFFMTGLHALHVIAGMTALTVVGLNVRKGRMVEGVEYAGMYWHLVDVVWIFLFPLLYLAS
jgi:heme/copper-type cytochrome/quinol oxidase subunit 3